MKTVALALLAASGLAGSANAVLSTISVQVWDGGLGLWSNNVRVLPGESIRVRYVVSTTDSRPIALNGTNFQPLFDGWSAGDSINLGATIGNYTTVVDGDYSTGTDFGRQSAFAFPNITAPSTLKAHVSSGTMRIAQTPVTNAPGTGTGINNGNGSGGVPIGQNIASGVGRPAGSPAVVFGTTDVPVYGVVVTTDTLSPIGRDIGLNAAAFSNGATVRWFAANDELTGSITSPAAELILTGATISIVPTPASLAVLGLGGLTAARRRRSPVAGR